MKIAVVGLWHLGCVTAACLAEQGHDVLAYDANADIVTNLQHHQLPIYEPGLSELIQKGLALNRLQFTSKIHCLAEATVIWVTYDTIVNQHDIADHQCVIAKIQALFSYLQPHTLVIISSQLPVGSTQELQSYATTHFADKQLQMAYIPENLRLGKGIVTFSQPERIIVGTDYSPSQAIIRDILKSFSANIIFMSIASAEMTKHAINAFLAISITLTNELAHLCEKVGADAREVELGMKSEARIGSKAYVRAGDAIAGGTLLRDINYLAGLSQVHQCNEFLFSAVLASNDYHKNWIARKLLAIFKNLNHKNIAVLGLAYKADTDTLRQSPALKLSEWLHSQGANVKAYDPYIKTLPADTLNTMIIKANLQDILIAADAIIILTDLTEINQISFDVLNQLAPYACIVDPNGFAAQHFSQDHRIPYFSVGVSV